MLTKKVLESSTTCLVLDLGQGGPRSSSCSVAKGLVSSFLRSMFGGGILVFRDCQMPLFKVDRSSISEVYMPRVPEEEFDSDRNVVSGGILSRIVELIAVEPRQWLIVANRKGLALRNTDHLIPPDSTGSFSPAVVDFYWARAGENDFCNKSATPGFWAVRGEHLTLVLERLKDEWSRESEVERVDEEAIWTRVVQQLPLRKRAFEKGEVVAPRLGAVDWEAVSNAAFVTVPDWPEKEAWKFLQALYFGTYLGDETGMMLNILEA